MKYLSIDLETSGLNPETCQIIEFAAVIDDSTTQEPLEKLPKFHCYVRHNLYQGEAYALFMHAEIFKKLANPSKDYLILPPDSLMEHLSYFLTDNNFYEPFKTQQKVTAAGKNFNSFDKNFINKLNQTWRVNFHHRALDPGTLYFDPKIDKEVPSTEICMQRAGIEGEVKHTALEDALLVIKLLRNKWNVEVT